jgi:hypothetical protein
MVSVYGVPQVQGTGHADVLLYFKCPVTQQMRCPVNAYAQPITSVAGPESKKVQNRMKENQPGDAVKYELAGWILFIIGVLFFLVSSVINHDLLTFMGSVVFLIGCIVFLIPIVKSIK